MEQSTALPQKCAGLIRVDVLQNVVAVDAMEAQRSEIVVQEIPDEQVRGKVAP
jgi:hypothetical protein